MKLPYSPENAKVFIEIPVEETSNVTITLAVSDNNHPIGHIQLGHVVAIMTDESKTITPETDLLVYCLGTELLHSALQEFFGNFTDHVILSTTKALDKLLVNK